MKSDRPIALFSRLRGEPVWRLLSADHAPFVLGLLQTHLYDSERSLPGSILTERIARDLEELRSRGERLPQTAQAYVSEWLAAGYLERRFPEESSEEQYELS